jgi:hypothetical protein
MSRRRLRFFIWVGIAVAVAIAVPVMVRNELAILHGPDGDFAGYWMSNGRNRVQRVWRIEKEDGRYTIGGLRLGGRDAPPGALEGPVLVTRDDSTGSSWMARLRLQQDGERLTVGVSRSGNVVKRLTLRRLPAPSTPDIDWSAVPSGLAARTIEEGIRALQLGIEAYRLDKGSYPPAAEVRPDGSLRAYVDGWPVDPLTNKLMTPGLRPGDYTYTQGQTGGSYTLAGPLPGGSQFVVP